MKLALTSSQTILQKGMCKQQLHHHLQMYALLFLHLFLTYFLTHVLHACMHNGRLLAVSTSS